jgi:hypothetical protein
MRKTINLTEAQAWIVVNALTLYAHEHRVEVENSPFPETQAHSRREWLKATDLQVDLLDRLDQDTGSTKETS